MAAMAVVLLSTTANANTISIQCNEEVQRGTLKLTNPPTMNCEDFELVQKYIGSDISVGPDSKIDELVSAIQKIQPAPSAKPVAEVQEEPLGSTFLGLRRNATFFKDELEDTKCASNDQWINLKLEDGGVTIRRNEFGQ